jgi:hypothetical protein
VLKLTGNLLTYHEVGTGDPRKPPRMEALGLPRVNVEAALEKRQWLRVLLGGDGGPDVIFERRTDRWMAVIAASSAGNVEVVLHIMDDGRIFVVPELPREHSIVEYTRNPPPAPRVDSVTMADNGGQ